MLNLDELNSLKDMKEYKRTNRIIYNFKFTKGLTKSLLFPNISFSLNTNMVTNIAISQALFANLFKRFIIAREIGQIRNKIIEAVLNDTLEIDSITNFFKGTYYWFEDCDSKIELLKSSTHDFLNDSRIEKIIFDQCKHLSDDQKKVEYEKVLKKINTLYSVAVLNSKNNLIIKTKADYYCYICNSGLEEDLIKKYQNFGKLTDSKGEK